MADFATWDRQTLNAWAADAMRKLAEQQAELAEWRKLRDPVTLHANLLRGIPAHLSRDLLMHLIGGETSEYGLLRLVADLRAALGGDGERTQPELIEYAKEMRRNAERYRWLRRSEDPSWNPGDPAIYAVGDRPVPAMLNEEDADAAIDAAIERKVTP